MFNKALVSDFILESNIPSYQNKTWAGELITRSTGIQYFSCSFKLTLSKNDRQELANFYAKHAQGYPFDMPLGWWSMYFGKQVQSVNVTQAVNAGGSQIRCNNNVLEVGTLVQFNHKKLYTIIQNTGTEIVIFPNLIHNVQIGEQVHYQNLNASFILTMQNGQYQLPSTNTIEVSITATENIRG